MHVVAASISCTDADPDLCTMHLWCFHWCKHPLAHVVVLTSCNWHWLLFHSATSADSPLAHVVVSPSATCTGSAFHPATGANTALALGQLALYGGGVWWYIYIIIIILFKKIYNIFAKLDATGLGYLASH